MYIDRSVFTAKGPFIEETQKIDTFLKGQDESSLAVILLNTIIY